MDLDNLADIPSLVGMTLPSVQLEKMADRVASIPLGLTLKSQVVIATLKNPNSDCHYVTFGRTYPIS